TDGVDTVDVTGDNRVIHVNRYDYLSTESEGVPTEFALHENYPNPFNPTTTLRFDLPEVSNLTLTIYNMLGQKIRTYDMQSTPAGHHSLKWNATNDYEDPVGAGVYLYQLQAKDFVKTRKMVLLK
ncbi:MAG: T9SS type A sorting domain-containing protein, partial [Candidatus Marinimicrobia bacterium]|nr:T9SS type A sorting domain-containing protein [Candidatus Neomarinimicrobiota bacterium]